MFKVTLEGYQVHWQISGQHLVSLQRNGQIMPQYMLVHACWV